VRITGLTLRNFRCFEGLEISLEHESRLDGLWTCIAGINGVGKSSILQALCAALLPEPAELGVNQMQGMRRTTESRRNDAQIEVDLKYLDGTETITAKIGDKFTRGEGRWWSSSQGILFAAYGASRNLSAHQPFRHGNMSAEAQNIISMFDPLTQLANVESLLGGRDMDSSAFALLQHLVAEVFDTELEITANGRGIRYTVSGQDRVEALDLPDGFRASVAWMADLCSIWARKQPTLAATGKPADMAGIVLIDEIDLHLHPSLQRKLVPRLRRAMPKVQWIVTTHSPLVLSNFDSDEIVALDRSQPGNVRTLDRQILGFTSDQIYQWLMGTEPMGEEVEGMVGPDGVHLGDEVADLLTLSPTLSLEDAREQVRRLRQALETPKP
jgi:predicted ATPase